jgi:hypothetical protein
LGIPFGYHVAEELETDLVKTVCERKLTTPDGIELEESLATEELP